MTIFPLMLALWCTDAYIAERAIAHGYWRWYFETCQFCDR